MREKTYRYKGAGVPKAKRLAIFTRDGWKCVYCDVDVRLLAKNHATLDHLIPNRDDSQKNLVTACFGCNQAKSNRHYHLFLADVKPDSAQQIIEKIHDLISRGIDVKAARNRLSGRRLKVGA